MDIIAAHRQGLIEQLDEEVAELAGRGQDHIQRAIVLHHLYHHSNGQHLWALAEARRALHISSGLGELTRRLARFGWLVGRRFEAEAALAGLAEAMGESARLRVIAAYRAYRMTATVALRDDATPLYGRPLAELLGKCHSARRGQEPMSPDERSALAEQSEQLAKISASQDALDVAWAGICETGLRRTAMRLLGDKALAKAAAKDLQRGAVRVEREFRRDQRLPASFRANPAQHFYALQQLLREKRRQQWRQACDLVPDALEWAA